MITACNSFPMVLPGVSVRDERTLLSRIETSTMMRSAGSVRFIVIHCTATRPDRDYTAGQLEKDHRKRGFRTVGYHFYIRRDGTVSQHRLLLEVGAHARPYNRCSIGVCYEGGLDLQGCPADTRTPVQKQRLKELMAKLSGLFPTARIVGHRDLPGATPKECPCFDAFCEYGGRKSLT